MTTATDLFIDGPAGKLSVRTKGLDARPEHVVILVQGANLSGQLGYDFGFDGRDDYSFMEALVARVYDDVPVSLHPMASRSLLAHLIKLKEEGRAAGRATHAASPHQR